MIHINLSTGSVEHDKCVDDYFSVFIEKIKHEYIKFVF